MKYLGLVILLLLSLPVHSQDNFVIGSCVLNSSCDEQSDLLKKHLINVSGMVEVLEEPYSWLDEISLKYYFLDRKNSKPLVVGIIDFGSDHSVFVLNFNSERDKELEYTQIINFGRIHDIRIYDVNNDGNVDFTCMNRPKGTGMSLQPIIYLNQNNRLIRP